MIQSYQRETIPSQRRGQAPVEVIMVLPLLMAMFLMILTVGSVGYALTTAAIEAYQTMWHQRHQIHQEGLGLTGTEDVGKVLRPNSRDMADSGVSRREAQVELRSFLPRLLDTMAPPKHEATGLSGTWDFRVLDFADERDHDPLQLGKRVTEFRGHSSMQNTFRILAGMSGSGGNGVAAATNAFPKVSISSSTNSAGIVTLTLRISQKRAELISELGRMFPNFPKINRLHREIKVLKGQRELIKQANRILPKARQ